MAAPAPEPRGSGNAMAAAADRSSGPGVCDLRLPCMAFAVSVAVGGQDRVEPQSRRAAKP